MSRKHATGTGFCPYGVSACTLTLQQPRGGEAHAGVSEGGREVIRKSSHQTVGLEGGRVGGGALAGEN